MLRTNRSIRRKEERKIQDSCPVSDWKSGEQISQGTEGELLCLEHVGRL